MKYPLIAFVRFWRAFISPYYGDVCKYYPSCSAYGLRALQERGAMVGSVLTVWRILRCNPWSSGGYDPVPGTPEAAQWQAEQAARPAHQHAGEDVGRRDEREHSATASSVAVAAGISHDTRGEI
ncbi:hypothetical protein GCM10027030_08580 [Luteococcus sediminum]